MSIASAGAARRRNAIRLLASVGITLVALAGIALALEAILRWRHPHYLEEISNDDVNYMHVYSETYGWALRPDFSYTVHGVKVSTNGQGYRGKEHSPNKTPGKTRLLIVGDSIAWGYGVEDSQTFSSLLDQQEGLEAINFGVQGYGTDQELIKFEREGIAWHPDVVILNVCRNDLIDNASDKFSVDGVYPKPYFTWEGGALVEHDRHLRLSAWKKLAFDLDQKSILYNKVMRIFGPDPAARKRQILDGPRYRALEEGDENVKSEAELTFRLIERMHQDALREQMKFIVLLYPGERDFEPDSRIDLFLGSETLKGITVIDLRRPLAARGFNVQTYKQFAMDRTPHLTVRGHQVVADIIRDLLAGEH